MRGKEKILSDEEKSDSPALGLCHWIVARAKDDFGSIANEYTSHRFKTNMDYMHV